MIEPSSVPPGWYVDGRDPRRRFWDGSQWTEHYEGPAQALPTKPTLASETSADGHDRSPSKSRRTGRSKRGKPEKLSAEQLTVILNAELAKWARKGWTAEVTLFGRQALLTKSKWRVFGRDVLLVLLTAGLWLVYVIYRSLLGRSTSRVVLVDRYGRVTTFRRTDQRASSE